MRGSVRITGAFLGAIIVLVGVGWSGFRARSGNTPYLEPSRDAGTVRLPDHLPAPVQRHFEQLGGPEVPLIESAVVWGTGRLNLIGLWIPITFTASYVPGESMERTIQVRWFGRPLLTGVDRYANGQGTFTLRGIINQRAEGRQYAQGGNLALWGESAWIASVFATDNHARWEAVDDTHARLIVPFDGEEDSLLATFDPKTGLLSRVSGMRYRDSEPEKLAWYGENREWKKVQGLLVPTVLSATWEDQGSPYVKLQIEGLAYNVDVSDRLPVGAAK